MKIPVVRGVIDRRILVNYRVDPGVLAPLLPAPFRPKDGGPPVTEAVIQVDGDTACFRY